MHSGLIGRFAYAAARVYQHSVLSVEWLRDGTQHPEEVLGAMRDGGRRWGKAGAGGVLLAAFPESLPLAYS